MQQNYECEVLLKLIAKELFDMNIQVDWDKIDLGSLYKEAKYQAMIATAFNAVPKEVFKNNTEVYAKWQAVTFKCIQNTLMSNKANADLTRILEKNKIPHCTIKGYASAAFYPKPNFRQMGDIDFFVDKENVEKTLTLLKKYGFTIGEESENGFHIELHKDNVLYEMHWEVTDLADDKKHLLKYFDDMVETSKTVSSTLGNIRVPDDIYHCIIMLLHVHRHLVDGYGIGIRHLCDWAVFANAFGDEKWQKEFMPTLKKMGIWQFARALSKVCSIFLEMKEQAWFSDVDVDIAQRLMENILQGGNFGRKDVTKIVQQKVFFDQQYKNKNIFIRMIKGINFHVYEIYPFVKKYRFLLPLGYIIYAFRILKRVLFSKNKIDFSQVYKEGNENFNLYNSFNFFEEEKK